MASACGVGKAYQDTSHWSRAFMSDGPLMARNELRSWADLCDCKILPPKSDRWAKNPPCTRRHVAYSFMCSARPQKVRASQATRQTCPSWLEPSLQQLVAKDYVRVLKQDTVVIELRQSRAAGRGSGSRGRRLVMRQLQSGPTCTTCLDILLGTQPGKVPAAPHGVRFIRVPGGWRPRVRQAGSVLTVMSHSLNGLPGASRYRS